VEASTVVFRAELMMVVWRSNVGQRSQSDAEGGGGPKAPAVCITLSAQALLAAADELLEQAKPMWAYWHFADPAPPFCEGLLLGPKRTQSISNPIDAAPALFSEGASPGALYAAKRPLLLVPQLAG